MPLNIKRRAVRDRFQGKVAIVTGGASGIGRATVEELCREGAAVAFTGISDVGFTTANEFANDGFDVLFCRGDMADEHFCRSVVDSTVARWGKINYLVNNAFSFTAKALDATREDWERVMQVGPMAYALMAELVVPWMGKEGGGAIVNMSSISAFIAQPNRWTYNSAKGAVHMLTKCQAMDLARYDIRVNSVSPAYIWTRELLKEANCAGGGREKWAPIWGDLHMLRRCGEAVECARPILFLLSEDASFITGADLPIDGGYLGMGPDGIQTDSRRWSKE